MVVTYVANSGVHALDVNKEYIIKNNNVPFIKSLLKDLIA
tara:strand:+ start:321 stop:440 length:120 start_codon:yes stop_codon:yes gene_type:complete